MVKAMRKVTGSLKVDLAQYRAMEAFAMFASDLDAASRSQLDRGSRLMELLKQRQYSPYPVEEQIVSIWAGTTGQLDTCRSRTCCASSASCSTTCGAAGGVLDSIRETGDVRRRHRGGLEDATTRSLEEFQTGEGERCTPGTRSRGDWTTRTSSRSRSSSRSEADRWPRRCGATAPRIKSVQATQEDHPRDGAHRGVADRQGAARAAAAAPYARE